MGGQIIAERISGRGFTECRQSSGLLLRSLATKCEFKLCGGILGVQFRSFAGVAEVLEQTGSRKEVRGSTSLVLEERFDL